MQLLIIVATSVAAVIGAAAGVLAWRAPQVYALAAEGFPGAVWPAV